MSHKKTEPSKRGSPILLLAAVALAVVAAGLYLWPGESGKKAETTAARGPAAAPETAGNLGIVRMPVPVQEQNVVDVDGLAGDKGLQETMRDRKEEYGVGDSVDAILKPDESLRVGDSIVPMREILEKIRVKRGEIVEDTLSDKPAAGTAGGGTDSGGSVPPDRNAFGIYVVKSKDNIWNIHFAFLKDYFEKKGIRISSKADEPDDSGLSSGMGKLLKFSEKIVYVYNLRERKLDVDLNLISPSTKIVVFRMEEIFALLDELDLRKADRIQFDGENIWIPAADS